MNPAGILYGTEQSGGQHKQGTLYQQDESITARRFLESAPGNGPHRVLVYGLVPYAGPDFFNASRNPRF